MRTRSKGERQNTFGFLPRTTTLEPSAPRHKDHYELRPVSRRRTDDADVDDWRSSDVLVTGDGEHEGGVVRRLPQRKLASLPRQVQVVKSIRFQEVPGNDAAVLLECVGQRRRSLSRTKSIQRDNYKSGEHCSTDGWAEGATVWHNVALKEAEVRLNVYPFI